MKITDVTATVLASRYDRPIHFAHMELTERRIILVRIDIAAHLRDVPQLGK
jgi:hypothetical protein